jgi:hypothetical protein
MSRNPPGRQEFRLTNQNFWEGEDLRFKNQNSGSGEEKRQRIQNYPPLQETQINSPNFGSGQISAGSQDSRYNGQIFRGTHDSQHNTQISQSGQEHRLQIPKNVGGQDLRHNNFNSAGRYNNHNSAIGVQSSEPTFPAFPGKANNNPSQSERGHSAGGVDKSRANSEDLYYKAFRSFSFRKNPTDGGSRGRETGSSSGAIPSGARGHQQFSNGKRPNRDHDIGFFEGLEEVHDRTGT